MWSRHGRRRPEPDFLATSNKLQRTAEAASVRTARAHADQGGFFKSVCAQRRALRLTGAWDRAVLLTLTTKRHLEVLQKNRSLFAAASSAAPTALPTAARPSSLRRVRTRVGTLGPLLGLPSYALHMCRGEAQEELHECSGETQRVLHTQRGEYTLATPLPAVRLNRITLSDE